MKLFLKKEERPFFPHATKHATLILHSSLTNNIVHHEGQLIDKFNLFCMVSVKKKPTRTKTTF